MGASTHRPSTPRPSTSYSGKGSSSTNSSSRSTPKKETTTPERSQSTMRDMLELLEEVERCRDAVEAAKKELEKAELRVMAEMKKLDPATRTRLKRMMGVVDKDI